MHRLQISALMFFCCAIQINAAPAPAQVSDIPGPIDRHALVSRHDMVVHGIDPTGALAVGNGEFAFNCDATGLQSFPECYEKTMPVGILSTWGWHSFPNPNGYTLDNFKMTAIKKNDREFVYPASGTSNPGPHAAYLRANPHRFGLGRIGLIMLKTDGSKASITDLKNIEQKLDLWGGVLTSSFVLDDMPVRVQTAVHPQRDEVGIVVESPLIALGRLKIRLAFPYASASFGPDFQDWNHPDLHQTVMTSRGTDGADFARTLDGTQYQVRAKWSAPATLAEAEKHAYVLSGGGDRIELTAWFSSAPIEPDADNAATVIAASRHNWQKYWTSGGAIDLSGTEDPRAAELERRIVLSEYVMAVHDASSLPPQETGLAVNSWFGKFHMEMYWWHSAHWALWGRPEILEKSLCRLTELMPAGKSMAKREGCKGVKWSKMTDPSGSESPSGIGPILVWQQPHPIYLAELVWRSHKADAAGRATLDRYKDIVFETADYMATFVDYDPQRKQFVLGPGVGSADEKHTDYAHNLNPTMELGYWKWALETAQQWRVRLGMPRDGQWDKVIDNLAPLTVRNGIYPALEFPVENKAANMATFLFGILPGKDVDKEAMRNTLHAVTRTNGAQSSVTWGTAMQAMCAARLNEPDRAIQLLSGPYEKNPFRPSGYTVRRPEQTPMYMPANGGWLSAVAMMAAGWDGNTEHAPGFPIDWKVRYEGLQPMP
jgi:Glycosyl hydrolase family 95 catalytic domain